MPGLMSSSDPPAARCAICSSVAAGPCARCRRMVCGDCCTLSSGGVTTFAVCTRCAHTGGASLGRAYLGLVGWLTLLIGGVVLVAVVLMLLR